MVKKCLKNCFMWISLFLLSFFISLLVIEIYFRIFSPQYLRVDPKGAYVPFGKLYRLKPHFYGKVARADSSTYWKINSKGLRNRETPYSKKKGIYRIIGLGDSFMFGFGVEENETFISRLESLLNSDNDELIQTRKYETVNMGISAIGALTQYKLLVEEGIKYHPDLIIMAIFVGNDIIDTFNETKKVLHKSTNNISSKNNIIRSIEANAKKYLGAKFHFYSFLSNRLHKLLVRYRMREICEESVDIMKAKYDDDRVNKWNIYKNTIFKIVNFAKKNNSKIIAVIIPMRHQVDIDELHNICKAYKLDIDKYDIEKPQKIIIEFCRQNSIICFDLLPKLRNIKKPIYFSSEDAHLNEFGHRIVANLIFAFIKTCNVPHFSDNLLR